MIIDSTLKYPVIQYIFIVFIYIFNEENTDRWDDIKNNI